MRAAPAVSCAKMHERNAHEHTGSAEAIRHSLRKEEYGCKNHRYINAMRLMCPRLCPNKIDAPVKPHKVGDACRWPCP